VIRGDPPPRLAAAAMITRHRAVAVGPWFHGHAHLGFKRLGRAGVAPLLLVLLSFRSSLPRVSLVEPLAWAWRITSRPTPRRLAVPAGVPRACSRSRCGSRNVLMALIGAAESYATASRSSRRATPPGRAHGGALDRERPLGVGGGVGAPGTSPRCGCRGACSSSERARRYGRRARRPP
jgi:hypothetical protein